MNSFHIIIQLLLGSLCIDYSLAFLVHGSGRRTYRGTSAVIDFNSNFRHLLGVSDTISISLSYKNKEIEDGSEESDTSVIDSKNHSSTVTSIDDEEKTENGMGEKVVSRVVSSTTKKRSNNMHTLVSLDEYNNMIEENKGKLVVVRFFSHYCKSCQAVSAMYNRLARRNPSVLFLDIPITKDNRNVAEALNITAVPFAHIISPRIGLVEEMRIGKRYWEDFEDTVYSYIDGYCKVYNSFENPRRVTY